MRRLVDIFGPSAELKAKANEVLQETANQIRTYIVWRTIINFGLAIVIGVAFQLGGLKQAWTLHGSEGDHRRRSRRYDRRLLEQLLAMRTVGEQQFSDAAWLEGLAQGTRGAAQRRWQSFTATGFPCAGTRRASPTVWTSRAPSTASRPKSTCSPNSSNRRSMVASPNSGRP